MHTQQSFYGRPEGDPRGPHIGGRLVGPQSGHSAGPRGCIRPNGWGVGRPWGRQFSGYPVPVNIESTTDSFVLTLFAAGLSKEKIQLNVQDDVLTIAYPGGDMATPEATPGGHRYTRREFHAPSFTRAFQLNGKVLVEGISARYTDGILTVTLPKNPATNQPAQGIAVG